MKTMKNFLSMAALALVGAVMTGCSSEDNVIDNPQQPENKSNVVTLTTTVGLDGGAGTRALTAGGVKTFAVNDQIAVVYKKKTGGATAVAVSEKLISTDIASGSKSATFTVTLDDPDKDQNVTYIYPAAMAKADGSVNYDALATQNGTLATLGSTLDYCTKSGAWNSGNLPSLTLENQLAILAITLKDIDGSNTITSSTTDMTLTEGTNTYSVTGLSSPSTIYVAIRPTTDAKIWIAATDDTKKYIKTLTKTYAANNGYNVSWKMATVGDVILSDGTFAKAGTDGALALITYVGNDAETSAGNTDYKHGLALALTDANGGSKCKWCSQTSNTCLGTQYNTSTKTKDMAGIANTQYLIDHSPSGHEHDTHAAGLARSNNSTAHPANTSDWFLPSAGQWDKMATAAGSYENLKANANLQGDFFDACYWSSTEYDAQQAWQRDFGVGNMWGLSNKDYPDQFVRAALAF